MVLQETHLHSLETWPEELCGGAARQRQGRSRQRCAGRPSPALCPGNSGLVSSRCGCASGRTASHALGSVPAILAAPGVSDRGGRPYARWPFPKGHEGPAWVLQSSGKPLWASVMDVTQTTPYDGLLSAFLSLCV